MRYRPLGRTGIEVSEIGFGAWGIGKKMWRGAEDSRSLKALHAAADRGLNFIDTAYDYGDGHSERLIGKFLKQRKERIFVATKVPPRNRIWPARGALAEVFPAEHIREYAGISRSNLGVETIDLLQLHVWHPDWLEESEWSDALAELREGGRIAHYGVSVNDHQPESALDLVRSDRVETVQFIYNIFDQSPQDELLPLCRERGVGVIARVPFDEGALTGAVTARTRFPKRDWRNVYFKGDRKQQVEKRVGGLAELLGPEAATLTELALKFCLHDRAVSSVIPGMRSVEHVAANLAVSGQPPLSDPTLARLSDHRWEKNFYS